MEMADDGLLQPGENIKPPVKDDLAIKIIRELYGLETQTVKELVSYDDRNFFFHALGRIDNKHIEDLHAPGYVLKVTNWKDSENIQLVEGQNKMMTFLTDKAFTVSEPVANKEGKYVQLYSIESKGYAVRVMKFIPGDILSNIKPWTKDHFFQCGRLLGQVTKALEDFKCPELEGRNHIWFLNNVNKLSQFMFVVKDEKRLKLTTEILEAFDSQVMPSEVMSKLEKHVIHGDFNEQNLLVRKNNKDEDKYEIFGLLDFGDSQHNCLVFDLAVSIMYMMTQCTEIDPNEAGGHVIAGYQIARKLTELEFEIIRTCVAARFVQSLVLGAYTNYQDPSNTYVLITGENGWGLVEKFWNLPKEILYNGWKATIEKYA